MVTDYKLILEYWCWGEVLTPYIKLLFFFTSESVKNNRRYQLDEYQIET